MEARSQEANKMERPKRRRRRRRRIGMQEEKARVRKTG
jgi:hypothetical protein